MKRKERLSNAGSLFIIPVIFCFLLAISLNSSAQSASETSSQRDAKSQSSAVKVSDASTNNGNLPQVTFTKENQAQQVYSSEPYYNYKGLPDPKAAKEAWVADHPEDKTIITSSTKNNSRVSSDKIDTRAKPD